MAKRVRKFDVLAAISVLLLCLVFSGWANRMRMLVIERPDIEVFVSSESANAEVAIYGEDDLPQQKTAVPSVRTHADFLGIRYVTYAQGLFGLRTPRGSVALYDWTLEISLWWFVGLFSILPLICLIRGLRRKSKVENTELSPSPNTFSLKNIFIAVTLVAIAGGMQALLQNHSYRLGYALLLWYGSGALAGAAIFGLASRPIAGAFIGLVFQGILIVVMKALFKISL